MVAQTPTFGVNVYSVVAVLFITGNQKPSTPLFEVTGKLASVSPGQIGATCVNVGIVAASISTCAVVVNSKHPPEAGIV